MFTTLNKIRARSPCSEGWRKLLKHLGVTKADDEPLALLTILESNGLDDALWCFRAVTGYDKEQRLFAVWCARQVQHLMKDQRSLTALDVAERYALGTASKAELYAAAPAAARAAAWAVAGTAARAAARAAARTAARTAARAARDVVRDVVRAASWDASWAAGNASWVARAASWDAAWDEAWNEARAARNAVLAAQEKQLRLVLSQTTTSN